MTRITRLTNLALIALALAMPFALAHGCAKQEKIEQAKRGQ
jgi:hypothetical protein